MVARGLKGHHYPRPKFCSRLGKWTVSENKLLCCVPDTVYGSCLIRRISEKSALAVEIDLDWSRGCMTSDLCDSLNSMFADLIQQHDSDEDISQDYLREEELRLCLEDEEMLRCEHEKIIVEENRFRLDEANKLRLEEENMLQLEEQKKNKRKEFMNSSHGKSILAKLAPAKRNQLGSSSEKINSKVDQKIPSTRK
ncbi:hypothetical protein Tco_0603663 [Tanacetum coccineum]